ncbi:MAG: alpha/beta hydrolase fold domain-containing protein, partial [Pseudomonadota bacterium]
ASDIMLPKAWLARSRDMYVGDADPAEPTLSPRFGDFVSPPPSFIVWAGDELLASDSVALKEKLEAAGGDVECRTEYRLPHVWTFYQGKFAPADRTIHQIADFIKARTQDG